MTQHDGRLPLAEADVFGMFLDMAEVEVFCSRRDFGYRVKKRNNKAAWISCLITEVTTSEDRAIKIMVVISNTRELWEKLGLSVAEARFSIVGMTEINERLRKKDVSSTNSALAPSTAEKDSSS